MAYYNGQQDQQYYDPSENVSTDNNLGPTLRTIGVAFALNMVGFAATKHFISGAKNTLRSWSKNSSSTLKSVIANKTMSGYSSFKRAAAPITKSVKESSIYKAGQERTQYLAGLKGKPGYSAARITSTFKNPKTFLATTIGTWSKYVLQGIGVAYGVDSLLGFTREMGLEKKKWYDVGGQVSNFGKWMGYSSIGGLAFGAAGPILGTIGSNALKTTQKAFGGEFGKKVLGFAAKFAPDINLDKKYGKILSNQENKFASDIVKKGLSFAQSIQDAGRLVQDSLYKIPDTFKTPNISFGKKTTESLRIVKSALKSARSAVTEKTTRVSSITQFSGAQFANEILKWSETLPKGQNRVSLSNINDHFFPEVLKQQAKETPLQTIFGKILKPVTIKDAATRDWFTEVQGNLKNRYNPTEVDQLMGQIGNLRVGRNIYHSWNGTKTKGGMVDLSFLDPINMVQRAISPLLNKQFFGSFSLAQLTHTEKFINKTPDLYATTKKPNFQFLDGTVSSIAELAKQENPFYIYQKGGKWAVFDGATTHVVDAKHTLRYSNHNSKDKAYEAKEIAINRFKRQQVEGDISYYNEAKKKLEHSKEFKNPFFRMLDKAGIGLSSKMEEMVTFWQSKMKGKVDYKTIIPNLHSSSDEAMAILDPIMDHVYAHYTSRTLSSVARSRDASLVMASHIRDKTIKQNFLSIIENEQSVIEKVDALKIKDVRVDRAMEDFKAYPERARTHKTSKRIGPFSDMTSLDIGRVAAIDDVFQDMFMETEGRGHILINMAEDLFNKGHITRTEKKALELHGKLSSLRYEGLVQGVSNNTDIFKDVVQRVRHRAQENNWELTNELIDFMSNKNIKPFNILSSQERILNNKLKTSQDNLPFVSIPNGIVGGLLDTAKKTLDGTTTMLSEFSPVKKYEISNHGWMGNAKYLGRTVLTVAGAIGAYRIVDTVTAANPLFDDTMLEEGVTGLAADTIAKGRLLGARVADITGITSTMKYLHGLAPYSETTLPGAGFGTLVGILSKASPLGIVKTAAIGGIANRLAAPYIPDFTKSYEELKEEYAGRKDIPIMKSPTWLLGGTPWEGSKVIGYSPNWYVRAKSRWKETDTMYGSAFRKLIHEPLPLLGFNVGDLVDPYFLERKHFFTRPFPLTGGVFDEVPLVGKILSSTIGRIIKPEKTMHQEFLTRGFSNTGGQIGDPYPFAIKTPDIMETAFYMNRGSSPQDSITGRANNFGKKTVINNSNWSETAAEDFLYDIQQFAGLKGFLAGSIAERVFDTNKVTPTFETAGRISSFSRSYNDMNLGGVGFLTEGIRRVIDKPEYRQYGINPIPNLMPNWISSDFLTGDPYCVEPDALIEVNKLGFKEAKTINTDIIYTHKGNYKNVIGVKKRKIKKQEKVYTLKVSSLCGNKTSYSEDHPIRVYENDEFIWKKIKELKKGDRICYPIPSRNFIKKNIIDLSTILKYKYSDIYIYCDNRINQETIYAIEYLEGIKKDYCGSKKLLNKCRYKLKTNKIRRIKRYLTLDEDIMYFFGLWIAEGWVNGRSVFMSHNIKEKNLSEHANKGVQKIIKSSYSFYPIKNTNAARSCWGKYIISDILISLFNHGAHNKQLPEIIWYLEDNLIYSLIKGYFDGDGNYFKKGNRNCLSFGSCNKILLLQFRKLLMSLGHVFNFSFSNSKPKNHIINGKNIKIGINYKLTSNITNDILYQKLEKKYDVQSLKTYYKIYKNNILMSLIEIKENPNIKEVYGFEILEDNSFCVAGVATHNTKILRGELRLPGSAYESTHTDVRKSMPSRASSIGASLEDIVGQYTGLISPLRRQELDILEEGTATHESIQKTLATEGMLIQAEALVNDVKNDITGHVDAIIRDGTGGKGRRALEIKTINDKAFRSLDAPKNEHYSQINFYLRMLKMKQGTILYVNRDNPSEIKTFDVNYSQTRWEKDLRKLQKARSIAATMMEEGVSDTLGYSYSWVDRLRILADTCPNSKEYKEAKQIVNQQIKFGVLNNDEIRKYKNALKVKQARIRSYELYPNRFKGKVLSPDTETNIQSINEDIKAGAEYSLPERAIGSLWERFTNTNTFLVNKLFAAKDPLEHYKMLQLYGKEYKPWDEPIRGWADPMMRALASKTNPITGAISYATAGFVFGGGPLGSILGAVGGAAYGAGHGMYRFMTNSTYIPGSVREKRVINSYFDAAKYEKNNMLASLSQGLTQQEFLQQKNATLTAFNEGGKGATVANLFRGTANFEKPYIEAFLNTRNPKERADILKYVPDDLAQALTRQWSINDNKEGTQDYISNTSNDIARGGTKYKFSRAIMDPASNLEDIKLKTINEEGFDQFEFGLGWNEQMLRIQESNKKIEAETRNRLTPISESLGPNISSANIRGMINNIFNKNNIKSSTQVYIDNSQTEYNYLNVLVRRDKSKTIINALNNREKYGL